MTNGAALCAFIERAIKLGTSLSYLSISIFLVWLKSPATIL